MDFILHVFLISSLGNGICQENATKNHFYFFSKGNVWIELSLDSFLSVCGCYKLVLELFSRIFLNELQSMNQLLITNDI